MALTVWDPFRTLATFDRQFDEIVRRAWSEPGSRRGGRPAGTARYAPATDISTEGDDVVVTLELPGVDVDKDVDIEVTPGRLAISGRRDQRAEREDGRTLVRELRHGAFRREFTLPEHVDADAVSASYERGLLQVRVQGVSRPEPEARKIAVSTVTTAAEVEAGTEPAGN